MANAVQEALPTRSMRVFDAIVGRGLRGRHAPDTDYTISRNVPIPMPDGVTVR